MREDHGFTLIEMAVVSAIIVILLAVAFPNFRGAQTRQTLRNAAQLLVMDLRGERQRANALSVTAGIQIDANGYRTFEKSAPGDTSDPTGGEFKKTVDFQRLFGQTFSISSPVNPIKFSPVAGGGTISPVTVTFQGGGATRVVELQSSGEVTLR